MKKTLIASAVAAAALSSNAIAMDKASDLAEKLDAMPTIYGNIQLAYANTTEELNGQAETSTNETFDNGSTIGFKHDHEISAGVTGFFKAEFHFDADEGGYTKGTGEGSSNPTVAKSGGLGEKLDEAFIGFKTDAHSVQIGTDDTVYEWVDIIDFSEAVGDSLDLAGVDEGDNVQYVGSFGDITVGATVALDSDKNDAGALAATYAMGDLSLTAAYAMGREEGTTDKGDTFGLAATYAMGDITLGGIYTAQDDTDDLTTVAKEKNATSAFGLLGSYAMGATSFTGTYTIKNEDGATSDEDTETSTLVLQALHNTSDNTYVYVEYAMGNESDDVAGAAKKDTDTSALAIGATYYF